MEIIRTKEKKLFFVEQEYRINSIEDVLGIIGDALYNDCHGIIIYKETLGEQFFNLSTKFAGELLQKLMNYNLKLSIVGDFSMYTSKSLNDFIYECNEGNDVSFVLNIEDAINRY